jgi:tetratricopeptide (TPR) repeat protein
VILAGEPQPPEPNPPAPPGASDGMFSPLPPRASPRHLGRDALWLALFIPIAGVIQGLIRAFDPDPEKKASAGWSFGGAVAGFALWSLLVLVVWPMLVLGSAGAGAYQRGTEAYNAGKMIEAENDFREAVKADPQFAVAWVNLAAAQLQQQNAPGAEESARRAVALVDAGSVGGIPTGETRESIAGLAHGNLCVALAGQLRLQDAAAEARKALAAWPDSPKAANWRKVIEASASIP